MELGQSIRFSIVVPTYNRRDVLVQGLIALAALERPWPCELIVVDDGSTDGSAEAARSVAFPYPVRVIQQENRGAAAARNRGAQEARGEALLFLDDDMIAHPRLLVEHDLVLRAGADAAVGHIPLHPASPRTLLSLGVDRWARRRHARLVHSPGRLVIADLLTGQLSVRASTFWAMGGFDERFNVHGEFGAEDTDFLYRLLRGGASIRYAPGAVTWQYYVVTPERYLRQWRQSGRADALLLSKHPELADEIVTQHSGSRLTSGALARSARRLTGRSWPAFAHWIMARARAGHTDLLTRWIFARLRDAEYWAGMRSAGGLPVRGTATVLAYHAVDDVHDPLLGLYSVTPEQFEQQIDALAEAGLRFVGVEDLLAHLDGSPLPERSVLLTFDDGYAGLLEHVAPLLKRRGIPALVLVVSSRIGRWNEWDSGRGAARLPLLDSGGLRTLVEQGWAIGAHSRTHAHLPQLSRSDLRSELAGCREDLRAAGLAFVPVLAYPYGEHDARVRGAARRAGYVAALALAERGRRGSMGRRYAVPRFEVTRATTPEALVEQVQRPPRPPRPHLQREVKAVVRVVQDTLWPER